MKMVFYYKLHKCSGDEVMAVCDAEIIGQTFRSDNLKLTVSESFYKGDLVEEDVLRTRIERFAILNLVGNRCVELAQEMGIVDPDNVIVVGGVKHAQAAIL